MPETVYWFNGHSSRHLITLPDTESFCNTAKVPSTRLDDEPSRRFVHRFRGFDDTHDWCPDCRKIHAVKQVADEHGIDLDSDIVSPGKRKFYDPRLQQQVRDVAGLS